MNIPTIQEIARKIDIKRQKIEADDGKGSGLPYLDEEEISYLRTLVELSELESVKAGTRQVVKNLTAAQRKVREILMKRSKN